MEAQDAKPQVVDLSLVTDAPGDNPNRMGDERYRLLVEVVRRKGSLQPMLLRPIPGGFEVVDGSHRLRAYREVGLTRVVAVIADLTDDEARIVRIGMNRIRGEVDLGVTAMTLVDLTQRGHSIESLTMTGFDAAEVQALVRSSLSTGDELVNAAVALPEPADDEDIEPKPGPFFLELSFTDKEDFNRAKRALRKAAGGGRKANLTAGLLRLIDGG